MNWNDKYLMHFLQNIYSVRNEYKNGIKRKIIILFGVKLKTRVSSDKKKLLVPDLDEKTGYGRKCFPKDVLAFSKFYETMEIEEVP